MAVGVNRGIVVGDATGAVMWFLADLSLHSLGAVVFFALAAAIMLSICGIIGGIWAQKFDHIAAVPNFVIVPLSFLSVTFYSLERFPAFWQTVAFPNPFFYPIAGSHPGFICHSD